jgi:hypothetical protein
MKIKAWIDDKAHEYLLNLVAQEYYSEAQEFIVRITDSFNKGLYVICAEVVD